MTSYGKCQLKQNKSLIFLGILCLIVALSVYFREYLTIEYVQKNQDWVRDFVDTQFIAAVAMFFVACVVFINSPVPLAAFLKIFGGYAFDFWLGAFLNIFATTIACCVSFLISRHFLHEYFHHKFQNQLERINRGVKESGFRYILSLRTMLVMPYFAINYASGVSKISFRQYTLATLVGVIIPSFIFSHFGQELEEVDSVRDLLSIEMFLALILVAAMIMAPTLIKRLKS